MKFEKFKKSVKGYAEEFVRDDSGMELLQFAIIVVISCGLIAAVKGIQTAVNNGLNDSASEVESGFDSAMHLN